LSRPYLIRLLEKSEIRFRMVGTHRRLRLSDVVAYKARSDAEAERAFRELVAQARRTSRSRGMLFLRVMELAVAHAPVRYHEILASRRPRAVPPTPPKKRGKPPSLQRPKADRPWRSA
jgi:excisionase family DNA binding protein